MLSPARGVASTTAHGGPRGGGVAGGAPLSTKFELVVPEDASPGDTLCVNLHGQEVRVVLPPDAAPGSRLTCSAPTRRGSGGGGGNG